MGSVKWKAPKISKISGTKAPRDANIAQRACSISKLKYDKVNKWIIDGNFKLLKEEEEEYIHSIRVDNLGLQDYIAYGIAQISSKLDSKLCSMQFLYHS